MSHAERRAVFPAAPPAGSPRARETTLATRSWRARVAVGALLRELRAVGVRGVARPGTIAPPTVLGRIWRLLRRVLAALLPRRAGRGAPELVVTADWRIPGSTANATIGRRRLDDGALRQPSRSSQRAELEARDVDALLRALGDVGPEELETALRVVRRVRSLAGAA